MANIVQYNAPASDIPQPNEQAASVAMHAGTQIDRFARQEGQSLGGAISSVGGEIGRQIDDHNASQAIGHGAAVYSSLYGDLTNQWNQLAAKSDPNDTSIAQGFKETVLEPSLQKFQQGFEGQPQKAQDWAQNQVDSMRQHFFEKTSADMSTRAAAAVGQNLNDMGRNFSITAGNDPTTLSHISDTVNDSVQSLIQASPYISAEDAAKIKSEVVPKMMKTVASSAFYGMAQSNPDAAIAALHKGDFDNYLDKEGQIRAEAFAREQKSQQYEDQQRARTLQEQQTKEVQAKTEDSYISSIISGKGIVAAKVAADPNLTAEQRIRISDFQHEHTRQIQENVDNSPHPLEFRKQLNQMFATAQNAPNNLNIQPVRDAFTAGNLNYHEETELEGRFNALDKPMERNFQSQMSHVERAVSSSVQFTGQPDKAAAAVNQIETQAHQTLDQWRQQGKDVTPLLDPASRDYLFSPDKIRSSLGTPQQSMAQQAGQIRTAQTNLSVTHNGFKFPTQAALDAYLKAGGK